MNSAFQPSVPLSLNKMHFLVRRFSSLRPYFEYPRRKAAKKGGYIREPSFVFPMLVVDALVISELGSLWFRGSEINSPKKSLCALSTFS